MKKIFSFILIMTFFIVLIPTSAEAQLSNDNGLEAPDANACRANTREDYKKTKKKCVYSSDLSRARCGSSSACS